MTGGARRAAAILVTPVLLAAGTACGFADRSAAAADPNTIELLAPTYRDGPSGTKTSWDRVIAGFEAGHPGLRVRLHLESWAAMGDVVRTSLQSPRTTPDLVNFDNFAGFARDGLLYRAADVISGERLADFQPGLARNATIDGVQYALPILASTRTLFVNLDLMHRAGVAAPPRTWQDLLDAARRIGALGGDISGYGLPLAGEGAQTETSIWTFGAGGRWDDGRALTIDTPANLAGLAQMKAMVDAGATEPNPGSTGRKDVINAFVQGRIGMIEGLPSTIGQIARQNPGLRYATSASPTKTGSPMSIAVADQLMAFVKDGRKRGTITAFLDYLYAPAVYSRFVAAEGFLPATVSATAALRDDPVVRVFGPPLATSRFYPVANPKWVAAQAAIQRSVGAIAMGSRPEDVLGRIARTTEHSR
ncbi:MAG: extracellular solute-binding protein [Mycobacteriaceae bacterium]|nr:extracellular solute-binding protein [Mycobacteriaceae bacterium]